MKNVSTTVISKFAQVLLHSFFLSRVCKPKAASRTNTKYIKHTLTHYHYVQKDRLCVVMTISFCSVSVLSLRAIVQFRRSVRGRRKIARRMVVVEWEERGKKKERVYKTHLLLTTTYRPYVSYFSFLLQTTTTFLVVTVIKNLNLWSV